MSKRYTSEHKIAVLALLDANGGSVLLTAAQCGIPQRTLRAWKADRTQRQQDVHQLPPSAQRQQDGSELPPSTEGRQDDAELLPPSPGRQQHDSEWQDEDEIMRLRNYVQQTALRIAAKLSSELESPVLFHKVSALNGLLDRLTKIENAFPKTKPALVIRVVHERDSTTVYPSKRDTDDE